MGLLWSAEQDSPAFFTAAGGQASLLEIYGAARDASLYVDNTFAAAAAVEEAYRRRDDRIFALTGERLGNPYVTSREDASELNEWGLPIGHLAVRERQLADWKAKTRALAERRPELAGQIMDARSIEDEALAISRDADERFTRLAGSRSGASAWLAAFIGGGAGALRDPVQVATLAAGGGPGAARTVFGRIMMTAATEAAVNAGVEAALQPIVQNYRAKAGIESGLGPAVRNVAFAGVFAGLLGAGGRGLYEALARGSPARALGAGAGDLPPALKAEIDAVLPQAAARLRDASPPAVRGAIDQAEAIDHLDTTRPAAVGQETHDRNVAAAGKADATGEPPAFVPDEGQIARIAEKLAPTPEKAGKQPLSLTEFLIARGGLLDDAGELKAMDAGELTKNRARAGGRGRAAVPDKRMPLDRAREAAEEAGYLEPLADGQTTTVRDLLNAIETELRGGKIYTREDLALVREADGADAQRAQAEAVISELAAIAGPGIDDALIEAAARRVLVDGETPDDALERVLVRAEADAPGSVVRPDRTTEPMPGWSDAELEAVAARMPEPEAVNGGPFDDPGRIPDELGYGAPRVAEGQDGPPPLDPDDADMMVPWGDGEARYADVMEEINRDEAMADAVRTCPI